MSKYKQKGFHYYPVFLQEHFTYTNVRSYFTRIQKKR